MDKQYSVKFFTTFIESLQTICEEHLTFDQVVEVSGYLSVEIDNAQKERYVLSELLQSCGNTISESYCTKAFKTRPVTLRPSTTKRRAEEEKENNADNIAKRLRTPPIGSGDVVSFDGSETKRRRIGSKSGDGSPRTSTLSNDGDDHQRKKDLDKQASKSKGSKSGCIGSRSSSFLASSARLASPHDEHTEMETLHDYVSNIVDSLSQSSSSKKQHSSENHPVRNSEDVFAGLARTLKKTSRSSSRSSTPSLDLPLLLPSTSVSYPGSLKSSLQAPSSKSSQRLGPKSAVTSMSKKLRSSSDGVQEEEEEEEDMNVSSLRHLVSKSNESPTKLKLRKTGMESDIPPGQAYIELVDEVKEELDLDSCHGDDASVGGNGEDIDADVARLLDVCEPSASIAGGEVHVSSSLMLDACGGPSSPGSVDDDDVESGNYAISEDSDFPDSPIIIDLDEDESSDDEEERREVTLGDDSDPFSSVELRKLETFKDYVKFAVKRVQAFLKKKNVRDPVYRIPPKKLDPLLAEFYVTVRNMRGEDFGVSTLKSIQSYLEQYLRENGYPVSITRDEEFANCRAMLATKVQHLRQARHNPANNRAVAMPLTRRDVEKLFKTRLLGGRTAEAVTNSMWFMNTVLFKMSKTIEHCSLKWGDVTVKVDEYLNEYLELVRPNTSHSDSTDLKIYPNNANPEQCFLKMYKRFQMLRPPNMLAKKAPFYLSVDRQLDILRSEKMKLPELSVILRRMLLQTGIQAEKQILKYDIL